MPIGGISSLKGCLDTRFGSPRARIGDSFPDVLLNNLAIGDEIDHQGSGELINDSLEEWARNSAMATLIGSSAKFRSVLDRIKMVAPVDSAVLIQGETGTGKEVIAQAIHQASPRHQRRLVAVNCAAIPSALLESELFGHERGAFTGAVAQTVGRFQSADGGTLFLDEIGDLPLELQPKLLRALQEKQCERLGSGRTIQVDARVVAATNQDLWRMVQERKFRADLYFRLNVFPITLPPLRERRDDIAPLVEHFVEKFASQQRKAIDRIPDEVIELLSCHNWPGNIRELQNVIERAVILTRGTVLELQTTELMTESAGNTVVRTLADAERAHIVATLRETNWVVGGRRGAATLLGLPRTTLITMMRRHGIYRETSRYRAEIPDCQGEAMDRLFTPLPAAS
jgi:formate hydrogenlyase transcriptional activator